MASEKDKMLSGRLYDASDSQLSEDRKKARLLFQKFNSLGENDINERNEILKRLFGNIGEKIHIEPPFYCDYGYNINLGNKVFFNYNCVILDVMPVEIGSNVLLGPGVQIYTATHPMDWKIRAEWLEFAKPVKIGSDVWIGGNAVISPGITIGDRSVIGAGSVVTKDVGSDVFAAGNPCKIIKKLN